MIPIEFRECPPDICNYYDKGPSNRRVLRAQIRPIKLRREILGDEIVVTTNYGKTYFRKDQWGDWKIHKTSESVSA
jgi:hypothetical protein